MFRALATPRSSAGDRRARGRGEVGRLGGWGKTKGALEGRRAWIDCPAVFKLKWPKLMLGMSILEC